MKKVTAHRKVSMDDTSELLGLDTRNVINESVVDTVVMWRQLARKNIEPTVNLLSRIALALYMTQSKKTSYHFSDVRRPRPRVNRQARFQC